MEEQHKDTESSAIVQTATDYIAGWYEGNSERMDASLHPDLAKRANRVDDDGNEYLYELTKQRMVDLTRDGGGTENPPENRSWEIAIVDRYEELAAVTVTCYDYVDFLQLIKLDGQWRIVNIIFTDNRAKQ